MMANDPGVVVAAAPAFELSPADLGAAGKRMNSASRWNGGDFKYFCEPGYWPEPATRKIKTGQLDRPQCMRAGDV